MYRRRLCKKVPPSLNSITGMPCYLKKKSSDYINHQIIRKMNEWNTHKQKRNIFCFWFPVEPPVLCSILGKESIILLKFEHQNFDELKRKKIVFWRKSDEINRLLWTTFSTVQVIIRNNNYRSHYYLCSKSLPTIKTYGDLIVIW